VVSNQFLAKIDRLSSSYRACDVYQLAGSALRGDFSEEIEHEFLEVLNPNNPFRVEVIVFYILEETVTLEGSEKSREDNLKEYWV
jgi:hypothetical protein